MSLTEVISLVIDTYELSKNHFLNSENRIYFIYLISSIALAFYVFIKTKTKKSFFKYIFDKRIWFSKSAFNDYFIFVFNNFIKVLFIGPYLIFGLYISFYFQDYLVKWFGFPESTLSIGQTIILYTIVLTVVNDFLSYIVHLCMHKIPILWEFHKVHHSATTMNPLTQYRVHPVELILNNFKAIIGFGLVTGFFDYFSNHALDTVVFIGANIFTFLFMFFGANLRHSHVKLKYPRFIEHILISPYQHQIHHSRSSKHHNKNLGSKFALWDLLFGTLIVSKKTTSLRFGIDDREKDYFRFRDLIFKPFLKVFMYFKFSNEE
tara:strand:+ start:180 stop:1139 length:960 start_codon:yes stop_codon:yes gene_type:complete